MIIKGRSRSDGVQLAAYLLGQTASSKNDHIEVFDMTRAGHPDLKEALPHMQQMTRSGQRGSKGLYHAQINPSIGEDRNMTRADWILAADILEQKLGFDGQPRAMVLHESEGRIHMHVVWQRFDFEQGHLLSDSWNYRLHEEASRELEDQLGHDRTAGPHSDGADRSDQSYDHADALQADRSSKSRAELVQEVTEAWHKSDSGQAFNAALADYDLVLARGRERKRGSARAFVVVDAAGEPYSLYRLLSKEAKSKEVKARLSDIDQHLLPSVEDARELQHKKHDNSRISQDADRCARRQAGQRLQMRQDQQRDFLHHRRAQLDAQKLYDKETADMLKAAQAADKAPNRVHSFFLKATFRYDRFMEARRSRRKERRDDAALARREFVEAVKETRQEFIIEQRQARKQLVAQQQDERGAFSEREQVIIKDRVQSYTAQYDRAKEEPQQPQPAPNIEKDKWQEDAFDENKARHSTDEEKKAARRRAKDNEHDKERDDDDHER